MEQIIAQDIKIGANLIDKVNCNFLYSTDDVNETNVVYNLFEYEELLLLSKSIDFFNYFILVREDNFKRNALFLKRLQGKTLLKIHSIDYNYLEKKIVIDTEKSNISLNVLLRWLTSYRIIIEMNDLKENSFAKIKELLTRK